MRLREVRIEIVQFQYLVIFLIELKLIVCHNDYV